MKKLLVSLFALVTVGNVFAYTVKMMNETDGAIQVLIKYGSLEGSTGMGGYVPCSNLPPITIQSGASKTLETGNCCVADVMVIAKSGSAQGKMIKYDAPLSGLGTALSCQGFSFKVSNPSKGQLAAETIK
jgi:hypothetical protein